MTEVRPERDESIESLIKRFTKKVIAAGIIKEVRDRQYFKKPSDIKRAERLEAKSKIRKFQWKMEKVIQFENENKFRKKKTDRRPRSEEPVGEQPSPAPSSTEPGRVLQPVIRPKTED